MPRCAVIGASGYLGRLLLPLLADRGHEVVALSRSGEIGSPERAHVRNIRGDAGDPAILREALRGADVVYHLLHSLQRSDFAQFDRQVAELVAAEAENAGVRQVVYLGGPRPVDGRALSKHLASRAEVGDILLAGKVPALALQASMIIGAGSASFELLRSLTSSAPAVPYPSWMRNKSAPIAVDDVLHYLSLAAELPDPVNGAFDIVGPQALSYLQLVQRCARLSGLPVRIPVPALLWSHTIAAAFAGLRGTVAAPVAWRLLDSLEHDLTETAPAGNQIGQVITPPRGGATSIDRALRAASGVHLGQQAVHAPAGSAYVDERVADTAVDTEQLWRAITGLGGEQGWHTIPLAWLARGALDHVVGGIGLHRGRPPDLARGDTTDFWTVLQRDDHTRELTLRADMRMPGHTVLQLSATALPGQRSRYRQKITFTPDGLAGHLYWRAQKPLHNLVFGVMARNLPRHATNLVQPYDEEFLPKSTSARRSE